MKRVWHIPVRFADYGILREAEFQAAKDDYLIHYHLYEIKELFFVNAMYDRSKSVRGYAKDILSCIEDADEETSAREKFETNFRKIIFAIEVHKTGMRLFRGLCRKILLLILRSDRGIVLKAI